MMLNDGGQGGVGESGRVRSESDAPKITIEIGGN